MKHLITREIGIDAGHRVTHHGSKCRNLHGHRYTIQATCSGPLFLDGEQQGMVLDFGFLKEEMMNEIDSPCDHGMILWIEDPILRTTVPHKAFEVIQNEVSHHGYSLNQNVGEVFGKLYILPFVPTAENLAKHWYERLHPKVIGRSDGQAELVKVLVYETPNCSAEYNPR